MSNIDSHVAAIKSIDAEIKALTAQRREHADALVFLAATKGKHTTPAGSFTISQVCTYDEAVMRDLLKPGQLRRVSKSVIAKDMVKAAYPEVYAAARVQRGFRVSVS